MPPQPHASPLEAHLICWGLRETSISFETEGGLCTSQQLVSACERGAPREAFAAEPTPANFPCERLTRASSVPLRVTDSTSAVGQHRVGRDASADSQQFNATSWLSARPREAAVGSPRSLCVLPLLCPLMVPNTLCSAQTAAVCCSLSSFSFLHLSAASP